MSEIDKLYHGTSLQSAKEIVKSGYLGTKYFDGYGFYVTPKINNAFHFGNWVFEIDTVDIDLSNLSTDDVNDGILYSGKLDIRHCSLTASNTERTILDTMFLLIEDQFPEINQPGDMLKVE